MISPTTRLAAALALSLAASAHAGVVYTSSEWSDLAAPASAGWCSGCGSAPLVTTLNPFSLSSDLSLTAVDIGVLHGATVPPGTILDVTVSVWNSDHSQVLDTTTFAPGAYGVTSVDARADDLSVALPSWNLDAGEYWISFTGPGVGVLGYATTGTDFQYDLSPGHDVDLHTSGAYELDGVPEAPAVPENSSMALMLAALAGMVALARARRA